MAPGASGPGIITGSSSGLTGRAIGDFSNTDAYPAVWLRNQNQQWLSYGQRWDGGGRLIAFQNRDTTGTVPSVVCTATTADYDVRDILWTNNNEVDDNTDTDGNGCRDDINGCNFNVTPPDGSGVCESFPPAASTCDTDTFGAIVNGTVPCERHHDMIMVAAGRVGAAANRVPGSAPRAKVVLIMGPAIPTQAMIDYMEAIGVDAAFSPTPGARIRWGGGSTSSVCDAEFSATRSAITPNLFYGYPDAVPHCISGNLTAVAIRNNNTGATSDVLTAGATGPANRWVDMGIPGALDASDLDGHQDYANARAAGEWAKMRGRWPTIVNSSLVEIFRQSARPMGQFYYTLGRNGVFGHGLGTAYGASRSVIDTTTVTEPSEDFVEPNEPVFDPNAT